MAPWIFRITLRSPGLSFSYSLGISIKVGSPSGGQCANLPR